MPAEFYAIIIEIIMTINRFSELISVAIRDLSSGLSFNHLKKLPVPRVLCDLRTGALIMIMTEFKMYVPVGSIHQRPFNSKADVLDRQVTINEATLTRRFTLFHQFAPQVWATIAAGWRGHPTKSEGDRPNMSNVH
jgi:hypothetical protein